MHTLSGRIRENFPACYIYNVLNAMCHGRLSPGLAKNTHFPFFSGLGVAHVGRPLNLYYLGAHAAGPFPADTCSLLLSCATEKVNTWIKEKVKNQQIKKMSENIFASTSVTPVFTVVIVGGHAEVVNCGLVVCWTHILQHLRL